MSRVEKVFRTEEVPRTEVSRLEAPRTEVVPRTNKISRLEVPRTEEASNQVDIFRIEKVSITGEVQRPVEVSKQMGIPKN